MASKSNLKTSDKGGDIKITTPEEYVKKTSKKTVQDKSKAMQKKLEKARLKKEKAYEEMQDGYLKMKQEYLKTALPTYDSTKTGSRRGGGVKVVRNLELYSYVLESLRASIPAQQSIFDIAEQFKLTPESAKQYYWQSVKYLREQIDKQCKEDLKFILTEKIDSIQRLAILQGDLKSALKAGEMIGKLGGLFEPEKIDVQGDLSFTLSFPTIDNVDDEDVTENKEEE